MQNAVSGFYIMSSVTAMAFRRFRKRTALDVSLEHFAVNSEEISGSEQANGGAAAEDGISHFFHHFLLCFFLFPVKNLVDQFLHDDSSRHFG